MFSLDRFYNILHNNLISQFTNGRSISFYPFGTYQNISFLEHKFDVPNVPFGPEKNWPQETGFFHCYFFDQEPLYDTTLSTVRNSFLNQSYFTRPERVNILANSEISELKRQCVDSFKMHDWYYFYHGFAALDWYRDFQFVEPKMFCKFDKVFMCYNHLISKYRSYRLHLVSNLIEQDLLQHGHVSLFLADSYGTWQDTIENPETPLDNRARVKIYQNLKSLDQPLIADTATPDGSLSAKVTLDTLTNALWHVVTETVYFQPKLHLTEKVFKPIVAQRPFILVAAPGNLAYLKQYGFETFDRWIDESYDQETDHYVRIEKITAQIQQLCDLGPTAMSHMHQEMLPVLEHNYNHFYNNFKYQIIDELVDNFHKLLQSTPYNLNDHYLDQVKKRLKQ